MKLDEWCRLTGNSDLAVAEILSVTREAVRLYRRGKRIPRAAVMTKLRRLTRGAVTANDFHR